MERCSGESKSVESEIGMIPEKIDFEGIDISDETKAELFAVDFELWQKEIEEIEKFYEKLDYVPEELKKELEALKKRVNK